MNKNNLYDHLLAYNLSVGVLIAGALLEKNWFTMFLIFVATPAVLVIAWRTIIYTIALHSKVSRSILFVWAGLAIFLGAHSISNGFGSLMAHLIYFSIPLLVNLVLSKIVEIKIICLVTSIIYSVFIFFQMRYPEVFGPVSSTFAIGLAVSVMYFLFIINPVLILLYSLIRYPRKFSIFSFITKQTIAKVSRHD